MSPKGLGMVEGLGTVEGLCTVEGEERGHLTPSGPASSWKTAGCSGAGSHTSSRAAVP